MKKSKIRLIVLCLFCVQVLLGQTYNYPKCISQAEKNVKITKIIRNDYSTQIFFEYIKYSRINYHIFLDAPDSKNSYYILAENKKYRLISTAGIANADRITLPQNGIPLRFSATFEAIPINITEFDLIEGAKGSWHFYGVSLVEGTKENSKYTTKASNDDCSKITIIPASPEPTLEQMLSGVKNAILMKPAKCADQLLVVYNAFSKYLISMGLNVKTHLFYEDAALPPVCSTDDVLAIVLFDWRISSLNNAYEYSNIRWGFVSTVNNDYKWNFVDNRKYRFSFNANPWDIEAFFINKFKEMYPKGKPEFNPNNKIYLEKKMTCWTESKLVSHFKSNNLNEFEGVYESTSTETDGSKYRFAVVKANNEFQLIYLSGNPDAKMWEEGELKATLMPSTIKNFFSSNWINNNKKESKDNYFSFENGFFTHIKSNNEKVVYLKQYPIAVGNNSNNINISGSGFAITSNGYIITNYHVVDGGSVIYIRGIDGNYSNKYSAEIVIVDKNNDLAILKINDPNFTSFGTLPYVIDNKTSAVGNSVFVLGYPLRGAMGDEVKLTNGIISSRSGFQGDVTSYQVSVPIQPGNSGGPLFDYSGNVIGVVNAKLKGAENASYAIKSVYILNLIDLLPEEPKISTKGALSNLSLPEQVKILSKFTYIIEVQ